jgi:hypothetical protein
MAEQPYFINQDKYEHLKQQINYEQLVTQLPQDKVVILDWSSIMSSFKDDENRAWTISHPSTSMRAYDGRLSASLVSGKERMTIEISSFNQGQKAAIEMALRDATNNNAPFIGYRLQDECVGDFCLVPSMMAHVNYMIFIYGNILIKLNHFNDEKEVLSVARYIQTAMEKAVAANPEQRLPARPTFQYTIEPARPVVGETFFIHVAPAEKHDGWEFNVAKKLLTDNIEYERNMGHNVYKFTAKSVGRGKAAFNLMDKKTLWVFTDEVTVNID